MLVTSAARAATSRRLRRRIAMRLHCAAVAHRERHSIVQTDLHQDVARYQVQ